MQEEELYHWWRYYSRIGKDVISRGHRLKVIYPGSINTARGPDFTAARFRLDGVIYQGDVECHIRPSDWYTHKHHLDKTYRHVVLHIVALPDNNMNVESHWCLQKIHTFVLPQPRVPSPDGVHSCRPRKTFKNKLRSELVHLALERFQQKTSMFINLLSLQSYPSIFHTYFFRGLGYPANSHTFQLLAEQLNWEWLIRHQLYFGQNPLLMIAVYAGQAGFLNGKCSDNYTLTLQILYRENLHLLPGNNLDTDLWQYAGLRPNNHPHFRLAAGIQLMQLTDFQLFDRVIDYLQTRGELRSVQKEISHLFNHTPDPYWSTHFAMGKRRSGLPARHCIGPARISELLINIILPLAAAQAVLSGSEGFLDYIHSFYMNLPLVSIYHSFEKRMPWLIECIKAWPGQALNQALLSLNSEFCNYLACNLCPINRRQISIEGKIIDNKIKNI